MSDASHYIGMCVTVGPLNRKGSIAAIRYRDCTRRTFNKDVLQWREVDAILVWFDGDNAPSPIAFAQTDVRAHPEYFDFNAYRRSKGS